jgi:hypothetical protein
MLKINDSGCKKHDGRQFTLYGGEADIIGDMLSNLPNDGNSHTFICEYGHTHRVSFNIPAGKLFRLSVMFSRKRRRSGSPKPDQVHINRENSPTL